MTVYKNRSNSGPEYVTRPVRDQTGLEFVERREMCIEGDPGDLEDENQCFEIRESDRRFTTTRDTQG